MPTAAQEPQAAHKNNEKESTLNLQEPLTYRPYNRSKNQSYDNMPEIVSSVSPFTQS